MAKKDKTEIDLEIESLVFHAADCNKNIKRKSYELLLTNKHEAEAIQAEIKALKIFENKGVIESMAPLTQPDDSRANLEAMKEEKGGNIGFNSSGESCYCDKLEQELFSLSIYSRETKDLKKDDSVQEGSVGERMEQEKPRIVLGGGDDEESSGDNDKSGQPGMLSWTSTVMENAEDNMEKLVPESGEGSEPKEEGCAKLMNELHLKQLKGISCCKLFISSQISEDMRAKLPVLELSIEWATEAGDSVVTRTIISLLKMISQEVKRKSEKGKSIVPDRAPIDLTIFNEFYQPILLFLDGMKRLEHILMLEAEPHTDSDEPVKNLLSSVKEYEREYLKRIGSHILNHTAYTHYTNMTIFFSLKTILDTPAIIHVATTLINDSMKSWSKYRLNDDISSI
ncbi:hypothetical protein IMY05_001G0241200 [Salix suchowensis]|nr:hypothetical protein IMY05_001G0241200 [Salix suchowensis]